jgi:hypothetical protein
MRLLFSVLTLLLANTVVRAQVETSTIQPGTVEGHVICNDGNVPAVVQKFG